MEMPPPPSRLPTCQISIIPPATSMNHVEGGWPKDVKTEMIEHKNKFIRKTLKEDMFKYLLLTIFAVHLNFL